MSQPQRAWVSTGQTERIDPVDRIPDFDPRSGDHLWTVITAYRVVPEQWKDPTHTPHLDHESLLSVTAPGCFHCEEYWTPRLASRRCPGKPRGAR